jgi:crossover junction endodeoxyribonuclease RuvC
MKILGIDPGYERLGIAILEKKSKKDELLYSECFKTSPKDGFTERLLALGKRVEELIKKYKPDALAIENLFVSNNQKTAMRVSEVRGALLYIAQSHGLKIHEYTPLQIKIAVTGYGKSDKSQVEAMARRIIAIENKDKIDDEMDAIAIAITGSASIR